jgi:penicillin-binding protein 2
MIGSIGNRGEKLPTVKLAAVQYFILIIMLVLAAQLWRLQVVGAEYFRQLAEQNRIRKEPIMAARGKLFDRDGRLLVDNYPSVSCFLVREQNHNVDADLPFIAQGLHLDLEQLTATLRRYRTSPGYQPIPSSKTSRPTSKPSLRRTATNCQSWKRWAKSGDCIRATASPRT